MAQRSTSASTPAKRIPTLRAKPARREAADDSRENILQVATREFTEKGLSGARVDDIAERTNTSKRMIYYYFRSKSGLFRAVLERCYTQVRQIDESLRLDALAPEAALQELVRVSFDYHHRHPDLVRLLMSENLDLGVHIGNSPIIKQRSRTIIAMLRQLIERGVAAGAFRADLDPVDLHMAINALCFYSVSNGYTFGRIYQRDMNSPASVAAQSALVMDIIRRWCRPLSG
jgi:AcrR family transcriptional regulator